MRALIDGDLVMGRNGGDTADEGVPMPLALSNTPLERLRFDGTTVFEAKGVSQYFIDPSGVKHAVRLNQAWQPLTVDFDAPIHQLPNGGWAEKTDEDLLADLKARLAARIDAEAEAARLSFITGGAGQAMIYQRKGEEARALIAAGGTPAAQDYPILAASVGIEADNLGDVAQMVVAREAAWVSAGAAIEAVRLAAKKAVSVAETADDAVAEASSLTWPKP